MTSGLYVTLTETLLQVSRQHPFKAAAKWGEDHWPYTALWARVWQIADKITGLDSTEPNRPSHGVSLLIIRKKYEADARLSLEIDYVAAGHAIWLVGRTVVFLSSKWTPEVLQVVVERANMHLILSGSLEPPAIPKVNAVSTFSLVKSQQPPSHARHPSQIGVTKVIPLICSITLTSGSTAAPKSTVYPTRTSLEVISEGSSALHLMDGRWRIVGVLQFRLK